MDSQSGDMTLHDRAEALGLEKAAQYLSGELLGMGIAEVVAHIDAAFAECIDRAEDLIASSVQRGKDADEFYAALEAERADKSVTHLVETSAPVMRLNDDGTHEVMECSQCASLRAELEAEREKRCGTCGHHTEQSGYITCPHLQACICAPLEDYIIVHDDFGCSEWRPR